MTAHNPDYTIGQTSIEWALVDLRRTPRHTHFPDDIDASRARVVRDMEATYARPTPRKRRHGKLDGMETRGAKALAQEDEPLTEEVIRPARYLVRVFYRSMGDELLAFDAPARTWQQRDAIVSDLWGSSAVAWRIHDLTGSYETRTTHGSERRDRVLDGARIVTLPSQRPPTPLGGSEVVEMSALLTRAGISDAARLASDLLAEGMAPAELRERLQVQAA